MVDKKKKAIAKVVHHKIKDGNTYVCSIWEEKMAFFRKRPRYKRRTKKKFADRGQYIDKNGYARFIGTDKLVHRYVAEKHVVGRKLLPNEEVHHKNRNKLDNRAKNLQVTTHGRHMAKHVVSKLLTGRK